MNVVKSLIALFISFQIISAKKYVILDTDGGPDDLLALMLAFHSHHKGLIDILGVNAVYGNAVVDAVVKNILLAERASNAQDIPVYKGASSPLMSLEGYDLTYFGDDGLNNVTHNMDIDIKIVNESAVTAMVRLVRQYPKQVTVVALGPLTNIALAVKIDPTFLDNLEALSVMGGTEDANMGNIGPGTEFNFINDPEAVQIVLQSGKQPFSLATWETALAHLVPTDQWNKLINFQTDQSKFLKIINAAMLHQDPKSDNGKDGTVLCDILAVLLHVYPDYVTQSHVYNASMELSGTSTRGQLVVGQHPPYGKWRANRSVRFVEKLDLNKIISLLNEMLSK